jgi:hypothetical protein
MLQHIEKFSRSTLNRMIGGNFLLLHREYAEFFSLSTQIRVNRRKVSAYYIVRWLQLSVETGVGKLVEFKLVQDYRAILWNIYRVVKNLLSKI